MHTSPLAQPGTGDSGGMNVYIVSLARQLAAAGVEVDIFTRAAGGDLPPTVQAEPGVRIHHIAAGPPALSKSDLASHLCAFYLGLASHPAVGDLDLLHGHYWMSGWVGRQANRRLGLPLVQSFHTLARAKNDTLAPGDLPEPALRLAAEERVVADADGIIASTAGERAMLHDRYGARPGQVHLVEPGVDLEVFSADGDRDAARQSLGGGRIVLFAGRLQPLKGPDVAVRALAALDDLLPAAKPDEPPVRLVLVGGPSGNGRGRTDPADLRRLAGELGVADRVAVLAARRQSELALLYRAADVVLMPSRWESFGLVALEAQACGTPVVGSAVSGLTRVIGTEGGGTLVHGDDPADFAAALAPYLADPGLREAAGAAGRRKAAAYSWQRTAAATLDVYQGALEGAARQERTATGA